MSHSRASGWFLQTKHYIIEVKVLLLFQLSLPSGRFPAWHLSLNGLEPRQHMTLESLESAVEHRGTYFVEASGYLEKDFAFRDHISLKTAQLQLMKSRNLSRKNLEVFCIV